MDGFELREVVAKARPGLPVFLITGRYKLPANLEARDRLGRSGNLLLVRAR